MRFARIITLLVCLSPLPLSAQGNAEEVDDRGYLQALLEDSLSGAGRDVRIEGFAGALSSSATMETLTIADADGVWLTLTDAQLDWRRAALLRGRLEVDKLTAEGLTISRLPSTEEEEPAGFQLPKLPPPQATAFSLPELPVSIQIGELGIETVTIGEAVFGEAAEVSITGSASLAGGEGAANLLIARTDGKRGAFELTGDYANSTDILSLSLNVSEARDGLIATMAGIPERPSLDLSVTGQGPLSDFTADIALATDGADRLAGRVVTGSSQTESGTTEQFLRANLSGDIRPLLQPDYRSFFGEDLRLELDTLRSDQGGLEINTLILDAAAFDLNGQISLGPEAWPQEINLTARIAPVEGDSVLLSIPGPATRLDGARLNFAFDADQGDIWDLSLLAENVTRDGFSLGAARMNGRGTIAAGEGDAVGRVLGDVVMSLVTLDLGDADLNRAVGRDLNASFDFALIEDEPFRITDLNLRGDDYGLRGDLSLRLPDGSDSPIITSDLTLQANDISRFAALAGQPIEGGVQVDVVGDVVPLDGAFDLQVTGLSQDLAVGVPQVDPLIGGEGALSVAARRDGDGTYLDSFDIGTPQAGITGKAAITGSSSSGQITARILDASLIHQDMQGEGRVEATFEQSGARLNADVSANAPGNTRLDATLETPLDSETTRYRIDLQSDDVSTYAWLLDRPLSGAVNLSAEGQGQIETQSGSLSLTGRITDLQTGIAEADTLLAGRADVSLEAAREADGTITLDLFDLAAPRISASANGTLMGDDTSLAYSLSLPDLGVIVASLPGAVAAEGTLGQSSQGWAIDTDLTGPGGMQVALDGTLAQDAATADLAATGVAPLALINRQIAPNIIDGPVQFDMALRGPLALTSLSGTARINGATLSLPAQKLAFSSIDGTVGLSSGRASVDAALAVSSGGVIRLSGPVTISDPFPGELSILIENMVVVEPGLLETTANGQLTVDGPLTGGARIAGQITFDEVGIQVPSTSGPASAALPGLVHRNEPAAVRNTRARAGLIETGGNGGGATRPYGLDVLVSAPARIFIRGRGLDAEMGGSLRVAGTTNAVIPTGRFELIRGRLSILGQRLDLTKGFIEPQGDLDPYMRIVAEASAGETDVRFVIEGPISAPELVLTSSPELPQDEILSRFLFGRDVSEISPLQALKIADALAQLSGRGPGAVSQLREGLGLDDLDVSTTETGETSVRAGKYISENIYSDVSRTTEGESEINLNLTITPNLTARGTARSDSSTSLGIFFEKDY
ncbi:translocation/assembly module TamB domain-containing protein [Aestuariivita boseongensis]|uniref:translocation/assembly module TamB domain-containing protein n=1 Tax=Aestuariivita boseongensis TaxID=1470562 RepID=UPI0006808C39|nr:translocation/assembly module TamB domain-containing protein [Aestuariivita boseongensis]